MLRNKFIYFYRFIFLSSEGHFINFYQEKRAAQVYKISIQNQQSHPHKQAKGKKNDETPRA